ncbi:mono/diheme cytochrome c family protein [Acidovorax soli]|uniref:Mono/diheme cytochrome c family protein n=1 Tax=Acidovorax soli TaxID=592050 RepID=A0A7X0PGJ4_9BURK|nr:cytochrome c [Acidovorax soli]MBB6561550.1 mono/diheme cytochrome c family protein [Acidovorax soli]
MSPDLLNGLLEGLHAAQQGLRALLHALGWAPDVHGQPSWPLAHRIAAEMLVVDAGHARRVLGALACTGAALVLLALALPWRRARWPLAALAATVLVLAPWPPAHLLLAPAVPTSLHQSPTGFRAAGIVRGQAIYQQHCVRCHGTDGRGEGPDAPQLVQWPPNLNGALLWKRLDGELFWRVREGMHNRAGVPTMPGTGAALSDQQIWEVLDYLQAHAAGQMLRESGTWDRPVRLPGMALDCRQGRSRQSRDLVGQRVRVAVAGPGVAPVADDPRLVTLVAGTLPPGADPECMPQGDAQAVEQALGLVLGIPAAELPGYQLIVDRSGWLRARGQPGQAAWSEDDLVCRSTTVPRAPLDGPVAASGTPQGDGLEALIRRMDAEPVRLTRGGFPH